MIKKIILSIFLVLACTPAWCANRFAVCADGGSWLSTSCWSTSTGGAPGASVPGTADVAILDANSNDMVVGDGDATTSGSINASAYTGTVTIGTGGKITSRGSFNLGASGTFTGAGTLELGYSTTAGTWTFTGGNTLGCNLTQVGTGAKTLAGGDLVVNGMMTWTGTSNHTTADGSRVIINGGYTGTAYFNDAVGNPEYVLQAGTISGTPPNTVTGLKFNGTSAGSIVMAPATGGNSSISIREGTYLIYVDGSYPPDFTDNQTTFVAYTGSIDMGGSACPWNRVQLGSGTYTLLDDWYINGIQTITGSPVINGSSYKIYDSAEFISYGVTAWSGDFAGIVFTGTTQLFDTTSFAGISLDNTVNINIPMEINTAGTITHEPKTISWGGGKTLTHTAGTLIATGVTWNVTTGGYAFNLNNATTIPTVINTTTLSLTTAFTTTTMTLETGSSTTATGNLTVETLRMNGSAALYKPNDDTVINVTTNFYQNGTDSLTPTIVTSPIVLPEFVSGASTSMDSTGTAGSNYRRVYTTSQADMTTFSLAFDYVFRGYTGYSITGGEGYLWHPSAYSYRWYYFMTPSDAYYFSHGMSANGVKHRCVFSKTAGSAMRYWTDNVEKSAGVNGSSANLINADIDISQFAQDLTGDVLIFNGTAVDDAWVAADYAKFVANGGSSNGQYDNTEPNLTVGWHVDSWTDDVTSMNFKYDGTLDNEQLFQSDFRYVDASTSAVPIRTMFGSKSNSVNVFAHTLPDIGGAGVSVTHY